MEGKVTFKEKVLFVVLVPVIFLLASLIANLRNVGDDFYGSVIMIAVTSVIAKAMRNLDLFKLPIEKELMLVFGLMGIGMVMLAFVPNVVGGIADDLSGSYLAGMVSLLAIYLWEHFKKSPPIPKDKEYAK